MPEFLPNFKEVYEVLSPINASDNYTIDAIGNVTISFSLYRNLNVYFNSPQVSSILTLVAIINSDDDSAFDGCIINTTDGKSYLCKNVAADSANEGLFPPKL